eukprot:SAG31_NODE_1244_length_9137_cov_36.820978_3_plen_136_part_00
MIRETPKLRLKQWASLQVDKMLNFSSIDDAAHSMENHCDEIYAKLEQSVENLGADDGKFRVRSRYDALQLLTGKRILFAGDSQIHETFNELCDFLGAAPSSLFAASGCEQMNILECTAGSTVLQFTWSAQKSPPL